MTRPPLFPANLNPRESCEFKQLSVTFSTRNGHGYGDHSSRLLEEYFAGIYIYTYTNKDGTKITSDRSFPSVHPVHHARMLEINLGNWNVKVLPRRAEPTNRLAGLRRRNNNSDPLRHREITPRRLSCGNGRCNRLVAACISRVIFFSGRRGLCLSL